MQNVRADKPAPLPARPDDEDGRPRAAHKPRGRPRAFDREAALAAAMRLFWHKGFSATSLSDLTEAMGIASPSLYAAFGSKEALYAEALHFYGERYGPCVWSGFAAAATARAAIEAYLMDSAAALARDDGQTEPAGCMVVLSAVGSEGRNDLGARVRAMRAQGLSRITARLERGVREGEFSEALDPAALARFLLAVQGGMALQARDGATRAQLETVARATLSGFDAQMCDGLRPSARPRG